MLSSLMYVISSDHSYTVPLFLIYRPGSASGKRSTIVFGTRVICVPDLIYTESAIENAGNYVVTVSEVGHRKQWNSSFASLINWGQMY